MRLCAPAIRRKPYTFWVSVQTREKCCSIPTRSSRRADEIVFNEKNWRGTAAGHASLRYAFERCREGPRSTGDRPSGCRRIEDDPRWSLSRAGFAGKNGRDGCASRRHRPRMLLAAARRCGMLR
jgi:hypothetical protein